MWQALVLLLALLAAPATAQLTEDIEALRRVEELLQDDARLDALRQAVGEVQRPASAVEQSPAPEWPVGFTAVSARWAGVVDDLHRLGQRLRAVVTTPSDAEGLVGRSAIVVTGWLSAVGILVLSWIGLTGTRARLAVTAEAATRRRVRWRQAGAYVLIAFAPVLLAGLTLGLWPLWQPIDAATAVTLAATVVPFFAAFLAMGVVTSAFTLLAVAGRKADRATTRRLVPQMGLIAALQIASALMRTPGAAGLLGAFAAGAGVVILDALTVFTLLRAIAQQRRSLRALLHHPSATPDDDRPTMVERLSTWLADNWHLAGYGLVALGTLARYGVLGGQSRFGFWADVGLFLALLALVFLAITLVERLHGHLLDRLYRQSGPSLKGELALRVGRVVRASVQAVLLFAVPLGIGALWGVDLLGWTGTATGRAAAGSVLAIPVIAFTLWSLWSLLDTLLAWSLGKASAQGSKAARSGRMRTLLPLLRNLLFITVVTLGLISVLSNLGIDVAPLLAGAGVVGLAVGFGAQKLVSDVITGMFLIVEDTIAIGETVEAAGKIGVVEGLTIRTLRLRDGDGALHSIPFSSVTTLKNASRGYSSYTVSVTILRPEDVDRALEEIARIGAEIAEDPAWKPQILDKFALWGVDQVTPMGVLIKGAIRTQPNAQWGVGRELNRRLAEGLSRIGIGLVQPPLQQQRTDAA